MLAYAARNPLPQMKINTKRAPLGERRTPARAALWAAASLLTLTPGLALADTPPKPASGVGAQASAPHVIVIQESNGFPGAEEATQLSRQKVTVQGPRMQVLDPQHLWALFIDLEEHMVREADVAQKQYVERPFAYYEKYRAERQKNLADQKAEFLRLQERVEDDRSQLRQVRDQYRRMGGDPDQPGRLVARLQHYPQDRKVVVIEVNGQQRPVGVEHYVIRENQADRPVFDLWVTRDLDLPVDLLRFYRELGTFSQPVSEKLQQLRGTIVDLTAVLDTGSFSKTFRSRVLEIRTDEAPSGTLTVPAGWEQRDPNEEAPRAAAQPVPCAVCRKQLPADEAVEWREPWGERRTFATCSEEHRRELIRKLASERK